MALDNERVAAAIVAMYKVLDGHDWDDTAEAIQQKAFDLWCEMDWDAERMAMYLWRHGWSVEVAASFTDITESRVWAAIRQYHADTKQEAR